MLAKFVFGLQHFQVACEKEVNSWKSLSECLAFVSRDFYQEEDCPQQLGLKLRLKKFKISIELEFTDV